MHISDGPEGLYTATLRPDGVLDVTIRTLWTVAQVDAFFVALSPVHAAARRRHGIVRVLVNVVTLQSPMVAMRVREHTLAIKAPSDRNAFVVATMLSKLQIRRLASISGFGVFTDRDAAECWLIA